MQAECIFNGCASQIDLTRAILVSKINDFALVGFAFFLVFVILSIKPVTKPFHRMLKSFSGIVAGLSYIAIIYLVSIAP